MVAASSTVTRSGAAASRAGPRVAVTVTAGKATVVSSVACAEAACGSSKTRMKRKARIIKKP